MKNTSRVNALKIGLHHWKGKTALILVKLPHLTVIRLNRANIQPFKVAKFYRRLYGGRQVCAPLPTHPYQRLQNFATLRSYIFVFNKSLSNLAILLILRRSFQWCRRIFPNLSVSKVEKTVKRYFCTELICFCPYLGSCP